MNYNPFLAKNRFSLLLLAIGSGLILWLGWPIAPFAFLLFVGFVPLLIIQDYIQQGQFKRPYRKFFGLIYLALVIWNACTTWWVYNSTSIGAIFMILANAFLMSLPLLLFHWTRKAAGDIFGYLGFIIYWMGFEYIHINWDLSWPWLTLGNGFAMFPKWIQWYEYTGVFGGTLWVLLANLLFFFTLSKKGVAVFNFKYLGLFMLLILAPILISNIIYYNYQDQGKPVEVVVLQPNIDPYTEKFAGTEKFIPYQEQVRSFIHLSQQKITPETSFLLWPETAIDYTFNEGFLDDYPILDSIIHMKNQYHNLSLLTGITSYVTYENESEAPPSSRYREDIGIYEVFNTGLFLGDNALKVTYHKSKLVPGVEIMPYPKVFNFLSETIFSLGGTSGGLGRQKERTVFYNQDSIGIAPSICYESIYGEFMAEFIRNGAHFIGIITNDGWWGHTPGHKQHFHYAKLRAIENRRSIARSANTGISGFFNQRGDYFLATEYWTQDVALKEILANDELTFYTRYGDYLARTATWLSLFIFLGSLVKQKIR
ncbi:MAG: apolipoprotein N-acyltransferase [Candidatus Cyclobacteriaceae bacterium M3_2C_046]